MTEYLEGVCNRNCKGLNVPCTKECAIPIKEGKGEALTSEARGDEPMLADELDLKRQAVNEVAAEVLPMLIADLEEAQENKDTLPRYEVDFLGDLYARLIVSVFMGYYPSRMADDAEEAAYKLFQMAKEHDSDADQGNS
jgi:hypothetical protein